MIQIQQLAKNDLANFQKVLLLFEEVFEMENFSMPEDTHLQGLLAKPDFAVFAAFQEDQVVGALTVYVLEQYYSTKLLAYIFDLAVATQLQRQGIGKKLIAAVRQHYQALGFEEVFVQANREDTHAVNFYRKTEPSEEEDVLHFNYFL